MAVFESSVYEPRVPDGGLQVLVMRTWPRGIPRDRVDVWLRDAAPSLETVREFRWGRLQYPELVRRYVSEITAHPAVLEELRRLEREHGTITLLCWERRPRPCYRQVLRDLLAQPRRKTARRA